MKSSVVYRQILRKKGNLLREPIEGTSTEQKKGFTLIELSIVLVIIGLIVAGVLTGQDLILAAKIRATTSQYVSYNTAANAFLNKYNSLPGDLPASTAEAFGFSYGSGAAGQGDGDGLISGTASMATEEGVLFWAHLYQANLIPNALTMAPVGTYAAADIALPVSIAAAFPLAKLGGGNYFWAGSNIDGFNYYGLSALLTFNASTTANNLTVNAGLSPIMAYDMDVKIDDGIPNTGIVQSIGTSLPAQTISSFAEGGSLNSCTSQAGAAYSANSTTTAQAPSCNIRLRFN